MDRRKFIRISALSTATTFVVNEVFSKVLIENLDGENSSKKPRNILLRSGWQSENIGDIAHTPAMMALIQKYIPSATVTFWPWYNYLPTDEVEMIKKRFPNVKIVEGTYDKDGKASSSELQEAINTTDFLLHNSGPGTIAWENLDTFKKMTGKPFGVFGVTYGLWGTPETTTLSKAEFVYLRDSVSLQKVVAAGVKSPIIKFVPDAVFSIDVTDDVKANQFLEDNNLEEGKFLCCIPHHRYTPVWLHKHKNKPFDAQKNTRNEQMKENDHHPLREAITAVIRNTEHKILICNEDETEQIIGKEWLFDLLPEDVKPRVVFLNRHWLTDEAISVYKKSAGLFGNEMHSPIMCIAFGIPAIVCRWEEQSSKGIMWQDIGLGEWLFDFDKTEDVNRFVPTVLTMASQPKQAQAKAKTAMKLTKLLHKKAMKEFELISRPLDAI
ncbi:polysaccharide pyruvyl transferase family protein [Pedobacter jamesrossensis]|uniref:Polysaccharide pyruvyl transferase family protein n=1 Tax=Pedobacter jamesrossensis TaxID=1908238 RepID=A0ABV8NT80_9SPHI